MEILKGKECNKNEGKDKIVSCEKYILLGYDGGRCCCLTPDRSATVHMFRSVFEQAVAPVVVFNVVQRDGLETSPA